jgi:hypothetical protein
MAAAPRRRRRSRGTVGVTLVAPLSPVAPRTQRAGDCSCRRIQRVIDAESPSYFLAFLFRRTIVGNRQIKTGTGKVATILRRQHGNMPGTLSEMLGTVVFGSLTPFFPRDEAVPENRHKASQSSDSFPRVQTGNRQEFQIRCCSCQSPERVPPIGCARLTQTRRAAPPQA